MRSLQFEDLPKAIEEVLQQLHKIEKELQNIKTNFQPKEPDELMTRKVVTEYFKVDPSTVWNWTNKRETDLLWSWQQSLLQAI